MECGGIYDAEVSLVTLDGLINKVGIQALVLQSRGAMEKALSQESQETCFRLGSATTLSHDPGQVTSPL